MEARTDKRLSRARKVDIKGDGSLPAVETGHILVEVWNPAVDYGRFQAPTDEPLTTGGHPLVATDVYSQTQNTGLRRGAVVMDPRTSARITPALSFTKVVPLEEHITEG